MFDTIPTSQLWNLDDWFEIAGVESNAEVFRQAQALGIHDKSMSWDSKRIYEWLTGTRSRDPGLIDRQQALDMIVVLAHIAHQNRRALFTADKLEEQTTTFLRSAACRHKFASLDTDELRAMLQRMPYTKQTNVASHPSHLREIRSRVQPAPPAKLFGRDRDKKQIAYGLQKRHLTAIDGLPGEGKTSLAWHVAKQAWETKQFTDVDWITDKQYIIDLYGNRLPLQLQTNEDEFLETLLISLCRRFGWTDLYGLTGDVLINRCADKLRAGRYLIVVDNLETVKSSDRIIRILLDMLTPLHSAEVVLSRALLTSRVMVEHPDCAAVSIQGIEYEKRKHLIWHLEQSWNISRPLSETQVEMLSVRTQGNPLFLQIALRRYALSPTSTTFDQIIAHLDAATHQAFDNVFESLFETLSPPARQLAHITAQEIAITRGHFDEENLRNAWTMNQPNSDTFPHIFQELLRNRIINLQDTTITMHALIVAYLLQKT